MLGVLFAILFFFLILFIIGIAASGGKNEKTASIKPNSVIKLDLNYPIPERTSNNPFAAMEFGSFKPSKKLGLNDIIDNIQKARDDDDIKGIYLPLGINPNGFATLEAVRKALLDFKESGKFIIAYGETISQRAYYLGSVADEVYLNPVGFLDFRGLGVELGFFKHTLEKLEIEFQIFYAGKYKSATEPFRLDSMSDANREQITEYLNGVYDYFIDNIAKSRNMDSDELDRIADSMIVQTPSGAVTEGLVEGLRHKDQVMDIIREKLGYVEDKKFKLVGMNKYNNVPGKRINYKIKDRIAIIYAQGNIVDGEGGKDEIGSVTFAKAIRLVREDEHIKALVLRVNSPGGSALASDVILREMKLVSEKIPVVVSMGNVAASGGYYISCQADCIVAEPNTITGSIGVFGLLPNMKDFYNNKLGITFDEVTTGKFSNFGSVTRPLTPAESLIIQNGIDSIYLNFKSRVASGRGMTIKEVDIVAQGRIWTGEQAKERGLVDVIGGLDDAIEIAANLAEVDSSYRLKALPEEENPFDELIKELTGEVKTRIIKQELGVHYKTYRQLKCFETMKGPQARMPFEFEIY